MMINAQITRNIPGRLHLCSACFRFFPVVQNYCKYSETSVENKEILKIYLHK
jgi:hypothetical protein